MQLPDQRTLGIPVLLLWAILVVVKRLTAGSLLRNTPQGGVGIWLIHLFNFFFLLVANPLAAILLIIRRPLAIDCIHLPLEAPGPLTGLEAAGMLLYATGYILLAWALITLRGNYQVGGCPPRTTDELVRHGPYRLIRHPMYAAVVCVSLGLACLTQSLVYLCVFCIYVLSVLSPIPVEEEGLQRASGEGYAAYRRTVKRLVVSLY